MIFPKSWKLGDRMAAWSFCCFIGFVVFLFMNVSEYSYYWQPTSLFYLPFFFFIWLFGSVFFTLDYQFRKATEAARWSVILIISGFFFLLWGAAEELTLLYLNWFSADPPNAAGVTSLALGLLLFCSIVANRSFPFAVEFWNKYWIPRRKEAEA